MADDEKPEPRPPTFEELNSFMRERGIPFTCIVCKTGNYHAAIHRQERTPAIISLDEVQITLSNAYANFYWQLVCPNCGNLQMFERGTISRWLEAKSDASQKA